MNFDADVTLKHALHKHNVRLDLLIAETALWANPKVHHRLITQGHAARHPNIRRARNGESKGSVIEGIRLDDNTYANNAIKWAAGIHRRNINGYEACHIWPATCYDARYHTVIANLVLLPRALAGLTDHLPDIQNILQYRAYELYGWYPEEAGIPIRPMQQIDCWREPEPDIIGKKPVTPTNSTKERQKTSLENRLKKWHGSPSRNVYKIIQLAMRHEGMHKEEFIRLIQEHAFSQNASGAIASLMTDKGNAYGPVLMVDGQKRIRISPDAKAIIARLHGF